MTHQLFQGFAGETHFSNYLNGENKIAINMEVSVIYKIWNKSYINIIHYIRKLGSIMITSKNFQFTLRY